MYQVEVAELHDIDSLERTWTSIQRTADDAPFFLTWTWISCWLATYQPKCIQVTASLHGQAVCVGLFTFSFVKRRNLIGSRQLRLHQTGIDTQDQIWVEYNDFLVSQQHRRAAVSACLHALESRPDWDELIISMTHLDRSRQVQQDFQHSRILQRLPAYSIDLSRFSRDPSEYLPSLSANTRHQVRKSARIYTQEHGTISHEIATTPDSALEFLHLAGAHHKVRWQDSGFNNSEFIRFHEHLIRSTHASGQTLLMRITAGNQLVGVLYFLLDKNRAWFYLQGINYTENPKLKPGLCAHVIAIEHFIKQGIAIYDFMGGYSQYKTQLGQLAQHLDIVLIQKPRPRFLLENLARNLRDRITDAANKSR